MNFEPGGFLKVTKAPVSFQLADATRMVAIHSDPGAAVFGVVSLGNVRQHAGDGPQPSKLLFCPDPELLLGAFRWVS